MASIYIGGWLLNVFAGAFWLGASYLIVTVVYNGVFHPLARYPGPFWARILPMYAIYHTYCKDLHQNIRRCHETYGQTSLDRSLIFMHTLRLILYCRSCCEMFSR